MDGTKKQEFTFFYASTPYPPIQCCLSSIVLGVSIAIFIFLPATSGFNIELGDVGEPNTNT